MTVHDLTSPPAALHKQRQRAELGLLCATLFWGSTFPVVRMAVQIVGAERLLAYRFAIAAVCVLPLVLCFPKARAGIRAAFLPGLGLGMLNWGAHYFQTRGLETVPSARAAFVTALSVLFVPLMSPLFGLAKPSRLDLVAAALAFVGLGLLTNPLEAFSTGVNWGDVWVLGCAVTFAVHIHCVSRTVSRFQPLALTFTHILGVLCTAALILPFSSPAPYPVHLPVLLQLSYLAVFCTVLTFFLQSRFQGKTTPERAALLFSTEPLFATIFGYFLLDEKLSGAGWAGAALILGAIAGSEYLKMKMRARSFQNVSIAAECAHVSSER